MNERRKNAASTASRPVAGAESLPADRGPWRCNARTEIYDNPWISVSHEEVTTPGGTPGIYGVVHFKHTAIAVLAMDSQQRITLVRQFRYTLNQNSWEVPEGGCPANETPLDCARRELREETGLIAGQWEKLLELHMSNSVTDEAAVVFLASELSQHEQQLEATEQDLLVSRLPMAEAVAMVEKGEITDALSVAAILAAARKTAV